MPVFIALCRLRKIEYIFYIKNAFRRIRSLPRCGNGLRAFPTFSVEDLRIGDSPIPGNGLRAISGRFKSCKKVRAFTHPKSILKRGYPLPIFGGFLRIFGGIRGFVEVILGFKNFQKVRCAHIAGCESETRVFSGKSRIIPGIRWVFRRFSWRFGLSLADFRGFPSQICGFHAWYLAGMWAFWILRASDWRGRYLCGPSSRFCRDLAGDSGSHAWQTGLEGTCVACVCRLSAHNIGA